EIAWGSPERWYAAHDDLEALKTASLDRVIGRSVDRWLRASARASDEAAPAVTKLVRRLQSEAQLVLYNHDVNELREQRGDLPVNSFWLSGCGRRQPVRDEAVPELAGELRAPLLAADWAGWAETWRVI